MNAYSVRAIRALAILIVAAMAVSTVPLVADEPAVETASAAADEGYVRVGWLSTVVNWNPLAIEMVEDYVVTYLIHSSLFTHDQDWGGPVNDLATSYSQTIHANGSMTTTITITDNAYFRTIDDVDDTSHPLTADDVVFALNLIKENEGGAFDWYLLEVSDIKKINTYTISVWTPYVKATLIDDLCDLPIVPQYVWQDVKNPLGGMTPDSLVGSGPFVYESMLKDYWYKFKRAGNYFGETDYPGVRDVSEDLEGIIYTVYLDYSPLELAMNDGTEDCVVVTGDVKGFVGTLGHRTKVNVIKAAVQENGITDVAINAIPLDYRGGNYAQGHLALLDPYVRQAIMMTLNKEYINETLLHGLGLEGDSVVDPGFWHKTIENQLPFDPAAAKTFLEANGWADSSDDDPWLEATDKAFGVKEKLFEVGTELSEIRCQAPDTDQTYWYIAQAWQGWAAQAGIGFLSSQESEITMINQAWYQADYDIWVWHWGWGPEPLGGALTCWLTSEIVTGGDNCQMPMGPWWAGYWNYSDCVFISDEKEAEFDAILADGGEFNGYSAFDENCSVAMHTLDVDDRKVIVDKLQQWVYDSYTENPPYYDLGLYGYTDYRFEGWGDWEAHNGLNMCSDLLWVWYELEPVENRAPLFNTPPEEEYTAYVGMSENFDIAVSDYEGDDLWLNISYGDGAHEEHHLEGDTTKTTWVNMTHTYSFEAEQLLLNVSLTDMFEGRMLWRNATVEVQETYDAPPEFTTAITFDTPSPVYLGTSVEFQVSAMDPDGGTMGTDLKFTWDWNDLTYTVDTKTGIEDEVAVTSTQTHTYAAAAPYIITVSVYDTGLETGEHNVSLIMTTPYEVILNQPPAVPTIQPIYGAPAVATTCVAQSSDADMDELTFTWVWDDGTFSVEKVTPASADDIVESEVTHTWAVADSYPVTVWVDDGETGHNVSNDATAIISEGNVPPTAFSVLVTPSPVYVDVETTFNVSAIDANGDALTITVDFGDGTDVQTDTTDGGVTTRQYVEFVHAYDAEDTYSLVVYANDGTVNESSEPFSIVVSVPVGNVAPTFQLQSPISALYNVSKTFTPLGVSDADGDELAVWFDWGDGSDLTLGDPVTYVAAHTYSEVADFLMKVSVNDSQGHNVSLTATVNVDEGNYQAALESLETDPVKDEYTVGETITFTVEVSDLEGDEVLVVIEYGDGTTDEETVDLDPKVESVVEFTHSYDHADEFVVNVTADDGLDHSDPALPEENVGLVVVSEGIDMMLVLAIVGILIVVVVVAALLMMKKKKGKGDAETLAGMEGMAPAEGPPSQ